MPVINTTQDNYGKLEIGSLSNTTYTAVAPTTTSPTTNVIFQDNAVDAPNLIHITPYTSQSSGAPGFRVVGWRRYYQTATPNFLYVPTVLADFSPTFTTGTVPSGTIDGTSRNFFSGVSQNVGQPAALTFSPTALSASSTELASVVVDAIGCQLVTVDFKVSSGSGVTMGVLWAIL
jgi:hypothetical protein